MKARPAKSGLPAFTLIELLVIIFIIAVIACLLIPSTARQQRQARAKNCENNLKQVELAFRMSVESSDEYVMGYSTNDGGTKDQVESGLAFVHFRVMSNLLKTPKVLACPADPAKIVATNFGSGFSDTNVSYFVGTDAKDTYPQMFLSGDRNFISDGRPVKPGLFMLTTNTPLSWTKDIHNSCGNILRPDGSVQFLDSRLLSIAVQDQAPERSTNRLAIP